jgi:hypothetical protein
MTLYKTIEEACLLYIISIRKGRKDDTAHKNRQKFMTVAVCVFDSFPEQVVYPSFVVY